MPVNIALVGNPNCGKTTLFNELTGNNAHVGNWPGVTVEKKVGTYTYKDNDTILDIVDLPGIYSLSPYTNDEVICRDYIINSDVKAILNIVDATNIERNLYLTTQILMMDLPVIIALNMYDVLLKEDIKVDIKALEQQLGVPVVVISAAKSIGIDELMYKVLELTKQTRSGNVFFENDKLKKASIDIKNIFKSKNIKHPLYNAVKFLDNDTSILERLNLDEDTNYKINSTKIILQEKIGDLEEAIADSTYNYLTNMLKPIINKKNQVKHTTSDKIDLLLTDRFLSIPIFLCIMLLIFHLTFTENLFFTGHVGPGVFLSNIFKDIVSVITEYANTFLITINTASWLRMLIIDGIFAGIGAVIGFMPLMLMLYFFISILEDTGYMARVAFIMDRIFLKFGLSGKSFLPLMMGFGCSVPAILATRTLPSEKERRLSILLIPFMSCGAKMPIYALIVPVFFKTNTDVVISLIYLLGILTAIILALIMKKVFLLGDNSPFIMELPPYRLPSLKTVGYFILDKLKGFANRVGITITLSTIVIWFLSNFGFNNGFRLVDANSKYSLIYSLGTRLRVLFIPLGFAGGEDGYKHVVSILSGLIAREAVVSSLGQLYKTAGVSLSQVISTSFTTASALSFIAFNLLSVPCIAAVSAIYSEVNNKSWFVRIILIEISIAYFVSFLVYSIANYIF